MTLRKKYGAKEFYVYTVALGSIAAGTGATGQFTVDPSCDFLWSKSAVCAMADNVSIEAFFNVSFTLTDAATGKSLSNGPEFPDSFFGSGQLPFILPTPKLLAGRSSLTVNVINKAATGYDAFYFAFIGTQLFVSG